MKVLVVGGTGTISRAIVAALLRRGHHVTVFSRGTNLDEPPTDVRIIKGDRRSRDAFEATFRSLRFDVVVDMISYDRDDAASALRAFQGRVGHFIHCSTVMTYGPPFTRLLQDETAPLNGRGDGGYGAGKVAADELLLDAHAGSGFPVTVVKPSFTYGPGKVLLRQASRSAGWIHRLRRGQPILSVGDGRAQFQFLPAADAGEAFAGLAETPASIGEVYNLVHPEAITWDEWHRAVADALGVEARMVHAPSALLLQIAPDRYGHLSRNFAHPQVFAGDKLGALLPRWRPRTPRREAIEATIAWMDRHGLVVPDDTLEDRIIAELGALPHRIAGAGDEEELALAAERGLE